MPVPPKPCFWEGLLEKSLFCTVGHLNFLCSGHIQRCGVTAAAPLYLNQMVSRPLITWCMMLTLLTAPHQVTVLMETVETLQVGSESEREQQLVSLAAQLTAARTAEAVLEVRARELVAEAEARQVRGGGRTGGLCSRGEKRVGALSRGINQGGTGGGGARAAGRV